MYIGEKKKKEKKFEHKPRKGRPKQEKEKEKEKENVCHSLFRSNIEHIQCGRRILLRCIYMLAFLFRYYYYYYCC